MSKEEIQKILDVNEDIITYKADKDYRCLTSTEKALLENNRKVKEYVEKLETENTNLKNILELGLNKEKQYCFNEDGHTGKCLGYGNDEPCDYCKSCERLSIKERE